MKKLMVVVFLSMLFAATHVWGQNPVPDADTIPNPVQEGDPAIRTLPSRMDYIEDRKPISPDELPDPVRQTLESDEQYADWKESAIFRDENTDEYIVEFEQAGKITTYRFDKEGTRILKK